MNLTRVTSSMRAGQAASNLTAVSARLAQLTDQSTSGKRITQFSDDPAAAQRLLAVKTQAAQVTQYQANASNATGWLATLDSSLTDANDTLGKVRDLVVQAQNGTLSSTDRSALASQLNSLGTQLLSTANTQYLGRSIFAGTSSASAAFTSPDYAYTGTSGDTVTRRIGATQTVRVDGDGAAVFGTGSNSVFSLIGSLASATTSNSIPSDALTQIDGFLANIRTAEGTTGAAEQTVTAAQSDLTTTANTLETQRSGLEDTDTATVAVELSSQQVAYQAALLATSKVLSHSLMDYMS